MLGQEISVDFFRLEVKVVVSWSDFLLEIHYEPSFWKLSYDICYDL